MFRRIVRPSPTATSSLVRGLLAPLAALALLGCMPEKESLGVGDDASAGDDETGDDDTGADETGADPTEAGETEPGLADEEAAAKLATECEQRFSCDCPFDRFADLAACEEFYMVEWAGIAAKAQAAGLTADLECYLQSLPYASFACDSPTEYYEQPAPQTCSFCQYAYGDRQVGETCQDFGGAVGDCAQGLLCYPTGEGTTTACIDPCSQAAAGESCNYLTCEPGLACSWIDMTCHEAGGPGEVCADGMCDAGLVCDWLTETCTDGAAVGESCVNEPCAPGLACKEESLVCVTPASEGESCLTIPCSAGLTCRWDDVTCAAPGEAGDSCLGVECAFGFFCDTQTSECVPPGSLGEACLERPCVEGLQCDYMTSTCTTAPGLGEPCFDFCADGLLCNWDVNPSVCAALPGEGEPCVSGACATSFVCDGETMLCVAEPPMLCSM